MGATKRLFEADQQERFRKQEALLELPSRIGSQDRNIREIQDQLCGYSEQIETLQEQVDSQASFRTKWKDYLIGGLVGAVLSLIISLLTGI